MGAHDSFADADQSAPPESTDEISCLGQSASPARSIDDRCHVAARPSSSVVAELAEADDDASVWDTQLRTLGGALARGSSACARTRYCAGLRDDYMDRASLQHARALERSGIQEAIRRSVQHIRSLDRVRAETAAPTMTHRDSAPQVAWELRSITPPTEGRTEYAATLLADLAMARSAESGVAPQTTTPLRGRMAADASRKRLRLERDRLTARDRARAALGENDNKSVARGAASNAHLTRSRIERDEQEDVDRAIARSIREYKDTHGWACEEPACSKLERFASDYELGCHARFDHRHPGPLPISSDAFAVILEWLPPSCCWIWLVSRVDRRCSWLIHHLLRRHLEAYPSYGRYVRGGTIFGTIQAGWHSNGSLHWYEEYVLDKLQRRWCWDEDGRLISDPDANCLVPIRYPVGVSYELLR